MSPEVLRALPDLIKNPAFLVIAFLLIKELLSFIKSREKDWVKALDHNTVETAKNTLAMVEVKVRLEMVNRAIDEIPQMKRDIDSAHSLIRELQ